MKHLLLAGILLLLCAGTLFAFTDIEEPDSFSIRSQLRQQPAVPLNLSIVRSGDTITLDWDDVTEDVDGSPITVISYEVHYGDDPDFECTASTLIDSVSVSELVLEDWTDGVDRAFFKVIAVGTEGGPPMPMNFVLVEGGTFYNGASVVTLSSFYMSNCEVTGVEYQAVMGINPSVYPIAGGPVDMVTWYNAIEYCNRRSINEGLTPCYSYSTYGTDITSWPANWQVSPSNHTNVACSWTANGYRLPTEAEWEFAARGGNQTKNYPYSGSNTIGDVAWYGGNNSPYGSKQVGTKAANELGIHDMSGNAWEWIWDVYGDYPSVPQTNPHGVDSGYYRGRRGGSWYYDGSNCLVYSRNFGQAHTRSGDYGFRLCRVCP